MECMFGVRPCPSARRERRQIPKLRALLLAPLVTFTPTTPRLSHSPEVLGIALETAFSARWVYYDGRDFPNYPSRDGRSASLSTRPPLSLLRKQKQKQKQKQRRHQSHNLTQNKPAS